MKPKHPTLPNHIIKLNKWWYLDTKTQQKIPIQRLSGYCIEEPVNSELKHEQVLSRRWDLNRD